MKKISSLPETFCLLVPSRTYKENLYPPVLEIPAKQYSSNLVPSPSHLANNYLSFIHKLTRGETLRKHFERDPKTCSHH